MTTPDHQRAQISAVLEAEVERGHADDAIKAAQGLVRETEKLAANLWGEPEENDA